MDIGSILAALALLAIVSAYLVRPLLERRGQSVSQEDHQVSVLLAERDRVLNSLLDLDMDRAMGKILSEDYKRQREDLVEEGARILRRLDELDAAVGASTPGQEDLSVDAQIEAEVAALRQDRGGAAESQYCPSCGTEVHAGDRFCTQCGEPLAEEVIS